MTQTQIESTRKWLFLFDLDGTLIKEDEKLENNLLNQLLLLKKQGHIVTIATGRSKLESIRFLERITPNAPVIGLDGQIVFSKDKTLNKYALDAEVLKLVLDKYEANYYIFVEDDEYIYTSNKRAQILYSLSKRCNKTNIKIQNDFSVTLMPTRIFMRKKEGGIGLPDKLDLKNWDEEKLAIRYSKNHEWLVISPAGMDKVNALPLVCKYCNVNPQNTIFFGDESNDIKLMKSVGFGVALGNAIEEVKQVADCCIHSVTENGVLLFLNAFQKFLN